MDIVLEKMTAADVTGAVELIRSAMNDDEAAWAAESMAFHFGCDDNGLDDGRSYYLNRRDGEIIAMIGLHRYIWGPPENVWLGWFAVKPDHQNQGIGAHLMKETEKLAAKMGYKKLLVETYEGKTFRRARQFYKSQAFKQTGQIDNYLPAGEAMFVFAKALD